MAALGSRPRGAAEIAGAGIWLMEVPVRRSLATVYWFVQKDGASVSLCSAWGWSIGTR